MNVTLIGFATGIVMLMPRCAPAEVLWKGDFETKDLSQWSGTLNPATGSRQNIKVIDSPVFEGAHAAEIVIHPDDIFPNGHNRVELRHDGQRTSEGQVTFFSWRFQLPLNAQVHEDIAYWETKGPNYQQSMAFYVDPVDGTTQIGFRSNLPNAVTRWSAHLNVRQWHHIAMKIVWSKGIDKGLISVWFDGRLVVDDAAAPTKPNDADLFIQVGFHRDTFQSPVETIYLDNAVESTSLDDLLLPHIERSDRPEL